MTTPPLLQIMVVSTRPVRVGRAVADYVAQRIAAQGDFDVELLDLAEIDLPLLNEPRHPRMGRYEHEHTRAWSATISRGDALLIVMPEYNHSFTAPLKNALDYLSSEWSGKPVALASYGGISGGLRAAAAITEVLVTLGMRVTNAAVAIPWVHSHVNEGVLVGYEQLDRSVDAVNTALATFTAEALAERARAASD